MSQENWAKTEMVNTVLNISPLIYMHPKLIPAFGLPAMLTALGIAIGQENHSTIDFCW
jgi:hypothetical protein